MGIETVKETEDKLPSMEDFEQYLANLKDDRFPEINDYLTETRGLNKEVLLKHKVGVGIVSYRDFETEEMMKFPSVIFPMWMPRAKNKELTLVRLKARAIYPERKHYMKLIPSGGSFGLFGVNTLQEAASEIVLTEGEYDAMAVHASLGMAAVSLPNGASHLPVQLLPWLEQFKRIYLWMDDDLAGREAAQKFSKKLGTKRCLVVKPEAGKGPKDANEALLKCTPEEIKALITSAQPIGQDNVVTFRDLRESVYQKILRHNDESGIMSKDFTWYNQKTKGFRRGELSIVTGSTGSGKTTLLSQLSLDFCRQGIPTLWGSFEIKNEILLKKLLMQFASCDLTQNIELFDDFADKFQELPLYLLRFFGSTDVDRILDTMDYAVYAYDIGHIVIDNLQFMLSGQATGYAKFDLQDAVIAKFRTFATDKNVHITTVIHPKKVEDDADLNISSVFGSAKATQEADNIFVLQNRHKYRLLDVRKNRFDGELGRVGLEFDKSTFNFFELSSAELTELRNNPDFTMSDVVAMRKVARSA
jgi:twinkle protein